MHKFHPFFIIGTVGMIVSAILHMVFALALGLTSIHMIFFSMYVLFISFLSIGAGKQLKLGDK